MTLGTLLTVPSHVLYLPIDLSGNSVYAAEGDASTQLPEKGNPKLGSRLNQLISAYNEGQATVFAQKNNIILVGDSARVIVECFPGQAGSAVGPAGTLGVVETTYRDLLQVVVPITQLETLADVSGIKLIRAPWYPSLEVANEGTGVIGATEWQTAGYTGQGVKVAVLDSGFTGYSALLGTDLPGSVTTQSFYHGSDIEGDTVHGTACAEVIYDVAPDAQFYLVNFGTIVELGNAVDWIIAQDIDIISCSFAWPIGGPGDGTGTICEMVDDINAADSLWVQAVGNSTMKHWQGTFTDSNADGIHEFSGADISNTISASNGERILAGLKWNDAWGSSGKDYELILADNSENIVAVSNGTQDGNDDPWEYISYRAEYSGDYHIVVVAHGTPGIAGFHLYSNCELEYRTASGSFYVPSDSPNAMVVGAVYWGSPNTLEGFSSHGPAGNGRIVPDLVAPDGVSTSTYGSGSFYGTSAATPHVAGAAALIKECYPSYTLAEIRTFLEGRAVDLGSAGKDNLYGCGRLDLGGIPVGDADDDGVLDDVDNCPGVYNPNQADADGDGLGDACDDCNDVDSDDVCDDVDNCLGTYNPNQEDTDGDGIGDACDDCTDSDDDGVCDGSDNCAGACNPNQEDADGDGIGDACDDCNDVDSDDVCDDVDNCLGTYNPNQEDTDGDGVGDACDEITVVDLSVFQGDELTDQAFIDAGVSCSSACTMTLDYSGVDTLTPGDYTYTVSCGGQCGDNSENGTVTVIQMNTVTFTAGTGGSLIGETTQEMPYGSNCSTVTAQAAPGYQFTNWTILATAGSGAFSNLYQAALTISNVTGDIQSVANFKATSSGGTGSGGSSGGGAGGGVASGGVAPIVVPVSTPQPSPTPKPTPTVVSQPAFIPVPSPPPSPLPTDESNEVAIEDLSDDIGSDGVVMERGTLTSANGDMALEMPVEPVPIVEEDKDSAVNIPLIAGVIVVDLIVAAMIGYLIWIRRKRRTAINA